jgi:hypothetical protein
MKLKTQILENKATDEKLVDVTVGSETENKECGKLTWEVYGYRIQVNAYPPTNDAPIYNTVIPTEKFVLENYFGTDTYIMRKV